MILQFLLQGAPSVYYGDEAGVGGTLGTNEGCRWPMPWAEGFEDTPRFRLYQTLARLRHAHPALREGGMKFLYDEGYIVALARFLGEEVFVAVVSTETADRVIELPLAALGARAPAGQTDLLGTPLCWQDGRLLVRAHSACLFACTLAD